jgi:hypothetical protein
MVHAGKLLENRGWVPTYETLSRGEWFAVHAGVRDECSPGLLAGPPYFVIRPPADDDLVRGAVVGVARFDGYRRSSPAFTDPQRRWWVGPVAWVLGKVIELPRPIPCRGGRSLWLLPDDVRVDVVEQLRGLVAGGAGSEAGR